VIPQQPSCRRPRPRGGGRVRRPPTCPIAARPWPRLAAQGPSGCGKTTCLDLVAGRKSGGEAEGDILFAGNRPSQAFLRRCVGYVRPWVEGA
jgi:hypothetical protein